MGVPFQQQLDEEDERVVPPPPASTHDDESEEATDDPEDDDEEEIITLRAKWQMDGASTLDEAVEMLERFIEYLKFLKEDGWELTDVIDDDYGFAKRVR